MRTPSRTPPLLFLIALLFLTQCQTVTPPPPKAEGFDPAIPAARSYLAGSLTFPMRELQTKINQTLDPVLVGNGRSGTPSLMPFSVVRSGPVRVQYSNQQLRFSAPLQVQLTKLFSTKANAATKKPFCSIHVDFMSPLSLTPAWRLASHVQFINYQWEIKPEIKLLGKTISLTDFARNIIDRHRSAIETAIDSAVYNDLRLDKLVSPIWRDMQKPLLIDKQYGLWLLPKPLSITAGLISGDGQQITVPLLMAWNTQTMMKPQQPAHTPTPLPKLQIEKTVPQLSTLHLVSFIPYADINRVAAQTIRTKPVKLALGLLTIQDVSVYGSQRSVIVKTTVKGLVDGTLYLRGNPVFDAKTNTLSINNLDFDAQTQGALSGLTSSLIHSGLRRLLENLLSISLGDEISQLPSKIDTAFKKSSAGQKINLDIRSFRFMPRKIAVRPDGIQTLIDVESKIAVQVQHL